MQTVFLILAHDQPEMLRRLVGRLRHSTTRCLVHVDRKVDAAPFRAALDGSERVDFVPDAERVGIHWSGFSMVRAELALLRRAFAAGSDRFVLLSGVDYPVRPLAAVLERVGQDCEWIAIEKHVLPDQDWTSICAYRRFVGDNRWLNPRTSPEWFGGTVARLVGRVPRSVLGLPIFYGSQWWSLTRDAVGEVLAFVDARPRDANWFRQTRAPDELFFQTVLKQTGRARHIAWDLTLPDPPVRPPHLAALHYVDFRGGTSPPVLTPADLPAIAASEALFARKFHAQASAALLDLLDRRDSSAGPR